MEGGAGAAGAGPTKQEDDQKIKKESPQLVAVLKEMKQGLDTVTSKVQALTAKVKANGFWTADGITYLEAKHLLLLSYCQSLVYYLLRKAKGSSIESHPVVESLVEIRLFLEKIRPIDKKMEYQVQKLMREANRNATEQVKEMKSEAPQKQEDLLKLRPNPDMLVDKIDTRTDSRTGVYKPVKIAPVTMDEDKKSKDERNARRRDKHTVQQASQGYLKDVINDWEGRPEEVQEYLGNGSREFHKYQTQWEQREQQEEELFTRAPITKAEKQMQRRLKKSSDGLFGLTDGFYDEIKSLPLDNDARKERRDFSNGSSGMGKLKKRKRRH